MKNTSSLVITSPFGFQTNLEKLVGTEFILSTGTHEQEPCTSCSEWLDQIDKLWTLPDNNFPVKGLFVYVRFPVHLTVRALRTGAASDLCPPST